MAHSAQTTVGGNVGLMSAVGPLLLVALVAMGIATAAGLHGSRGAAVISGIATVVSIALLVPTAGGCLNTYPTPCSVSSLAYTASWLTNDGIGLDLSFDTVFFGLVAASVMVGIATMTMGLVALRRLQAGPTAGITRGATDDS